MPVDPAVLPVFLSVSLVLLITPGPDVAFIIATGMVEGRRPALWAALGIALAMFTHAILAAVGVAALVATSPLAYDLIRYGGAAYLCVLAYQAFRAGPTHASTAAPPPTPSAQLRRGFLTNLLNPKAILFSGVFLPQFASTSYGSLFWQIVGLGAILAGMGLVFQATLALTSGSFGQWLLASPQRKQWLDRLMGVVYVGLALRLVTLERKS
jgi:threonine/homoserine/homoserine lactone efflux protein